MSDLPLKSMVFMDLCGERGVGKCGISFALNCLSGSGANDGFFRLPLASVLRFGAQGWVTLGLVANFIPPVTELRSPWRILRFTGLALKLALTWESSEDLLSEIFFGLERLNSLNLVVSCFYVFYAAVWGFSRILGLSGLALNF